MFGPDYLCVSLALAFLATVPVVLCWPAKREDYGTTTTTRETVNIHQAETRKE